jgi:hypothetical protein
VDERLSDFEKGVILGLLIAEGHFGGDGRQPHVTLKMHVRRERLLRWINNRVRWSRLFGPYLHSGRHYFQLMFRGPAITQSLGPMLRSLPWAEIDDHSLGRFEKMIADYGVRLSEDVVSRESLS